MERVLVVGAGFMGGGIAQVCAQSGRQVNLMDVSSQALQKAKAGMEFSLGRLSAKGVIAETPEQVLARLSLEQDLAAAEQADWIIEAALEKEGLKLELFAELDRLAPAATPIGSNTSSIPIGRLAGACQHPGRVLGLHFFGPVPLMGLVEVIKGEATSDQVFERSLEFIRSLGKTPVKVTKDLPGFVMNRVFAAALSEAVDLVAAGVCTPEDVDAGMRLGYGWKAGPFEIADNAGLDTIALIDEFLISQGEDKLVAKSGLVKRLADQGRLGRKVGKGFYRYTPEGKREPWGDED
ncbi:MAG: 3-hydroxyacyl-CoA dehydrogenase family protein [Desulfarculaceae bacterium]|nr:3-hydroxyacyl-CoA dehydrogenase family protein [Desulfarculaceae bacterium]MCF8071690.1 3-hydroxyacyl-CoA dehydrogenase family protein [Desulfarculaceae bacterium]MCF8102463.1 3-hydroxyacyl-CoA dehydrogenase family protein [Desulfarculaceae bacterium]MCF8116805.1 3-hydroxyacyl-CoA dehydrogenase family protein [Desulfarculaceae bacterium]